MRGSTRREFYKLREIVHFLLAGAGVTPRGENGSLLCYFCRKGLDEYAEFETHGNSVGPKFLAKLTIHHVNDNHDDNVMTNKALSHTPCHKGYHRRLANALRKIKAPHVQGD